MTANANPPIRGGRGYSALELRPFDLSPEVSPEVPELDLPSNPDQGRVVAVRATTLAREHDWGAHAAAAIAAIWAARGARVLLVDLCLDEPRLHGVFGARNLEGIADAIEYGASLGRIARAANDGAFWVATAGTPVADAGALLDRARWRRLLDAWVGMGVTVAVYQEAESPVHPRGASSIVLACKGEPMVALGKTGLRDAMALLGPAPDGAAVAGAAKESGHRLGGQTHDASPWGDSDGGAASWDDASGKASADSAAFGGWTGTSPDGSASSSAGRAEASAGERAATGSASADPGSHVPGRGLAVAAFAILIVFAMVMILMMIDDSGIADVPGTDWLRERFEALLDRISQFFVR